MQFTKNFIILQRIYNITIQTNDSDILTWGQLHT